MAVLGFLLCFYLFCHSFAGAATWRIPLGSKISVSHPSYWVSPKAHFAFGFSNHSDLPNQYVAGIRFNSPKIPPAHQTVVWVVGGGVIVGQDSYFHLTGDGDMVLFDGVRRSVTWCSNTSHLSVASAALMDEGNLVLFDLRGVAVWQSFDTPFDTLLPGQNLTSARVLRAASGNSIASYYSLHIDASDQLVLAWESNVSYWRSDAAGLGTPRVLTFTEGGKLDLLDGNSSSVWSRVADDHDDPSIQFRYLRLDADGNLRIYSWSETSRSWIVVWQAVQDQCEVFAACGLRGVCMYSATGSTDCVCPFYPASNSTLNCLTPYKQKCGSGSTMLMLDNTFLYGIYPPHDSVMNIGAEGCRRSCLEDPLCTSASVRNDGSGQCWLKRTQFVSGFRHPSLPSVSFVKQCLDPIAVIPHNITGSPPSASHSKDGRYRKLWTPYIFVGASLCTFIILAAIQIIVGLWLVTRRKKIDRVSGISTLSINSIGVVPLSYAELQKLTDGFKEQLGPNVHKGVLPQDQIIVVKALNDLGQVEEKQFRCWISVLGSIYHKNLLKLVAYCYTAEHRCVVYPFAKYGSVDKWLEEAKLAKRLNWSKRMEICLGVARAMSYLHTGCREFISHGNLKWKNVVLDEQFEPKLTEFGFCKFTGGSQHGYPAEEDAAKFGEMLLVMVTGNRGGSEVCWWAYKEWASAHVENLVDSRMTGKADFGDVERMLRVAFWCIQDDVRLRPSMSEVTKVLEGSLPVDPPPPPYRMPEIPVEGTLLIEEVS